MKFLLIFKIMLACGILEEPVSEAEFIAIDHTSPEEQYDHLTNKVHDSHWDISYGIPLQGNGCREGAELDSDEKLTQAITTALRVWLQLRPRPEFSCRYFFTTPGKI